MTGDVGLLPQDAGLLKDSTTSNASLYEASRLLQLNHNKWHIFFRDVVGHNHIAHSVLTALAMGATPEELQRAYDDGEKIQRAIPKVDDEALKKCQQGRLEDYVGDCSQYATFLTFFEQEIEAHGWKSVVQTYVFARTPLADKILVKMYEGIYHSLIHLGLGIEFGLPGIVAEALAQAASHEDGHIDKLLLGCEEYVTAHSGTVPSKPLMQLLKAVRGNDKVYQAAKFEMGWNALRDGVMDQASNDLIPIAANFRVEEDTLGHRTAEMINVAAYLAGASQRPLRKRKIDFVLMHVVTSSIFFSVFEKQDWIKLEDKIRLVEWKGRLDLAFYAYCHCPDLHVETINEYYDEYSKDMDWTELYAVVNKEHDDGHVAKFVRALRNGQMLEYPGGDFPVKGEMWIKIARMALGTTHGLPQPLKWIQSTGFDEAWANRSDL